MYKSQKDYFCPSAIRCPCIQILTYAMIQKTLVSFCLLRECGHRSVEARHEVKATDKYESNSVLLREWLWPEKKQTVFLANK